MKIAAKRRQNMSFASEGEKADYERLIRSNPKNDGLYGLPRQALFPPSRIAPLSVSHVPDLSEEEKKKMAEDNKVLASVEDSVSYCWFCEKETPHQRWDGQPEFCKKCGNVSRTNYQGATQ